MVYNGILMETIGISVMVSIVFLAGSNRTKNNGRDKNNFFQSIF